MPKWGEARPRPAALALALIVCLAVAFAGCAWDQGQADSNEIRWLQRLGRWEAQMDEDAEQAFSAYSAALAGEQPPDSLSASLRPIRRCSRRLRRDVGDAPKRYEKGYSLMLEACGRYERYAEELERSFDGNPGDALFASEAASEDADRLVLLARRAIERGLRANRQLPRARGDTEQSRVEPFFSRAASAIVGRPVEVVCWSRDEWPTVLREWGAYIGTTEIGAFAHYDGDRVYLGPEFCEGLVDLAYRGKRPTSGEAHEKIADGVSTLGHEAEHLVAAGAGEAETECYGMQDIRRIARQLGASPDYAAGLAEVYWEELYRTLPDAYVSSDCRDGGLWDRNDTSETWP